MSISPLYRMAAGRFHPTESAGGPWSHESQHGGPPCGLLARAIETTADDPELVPVRFLVDLFRAVPMQPIEVRTEVVRRGRRLTLIDARLLADGRPVARASGLLLRRGEAPAYEPEEETPRGPEGLQTVPMISETQRSTMPPGFHFECQVRWVESSTRPVAWLRMPMALVEGEEPSAFQRLAALSDFGNALSSRGRWKGQPDPVAFINADCALYLSRPPGGEWFAFEADRIADRDGVGTSETVVRDIDGRCGRVLQARLANPVPPRWEGRGD